jgi:hypothetical protein
MNQAEYFEANQVDGQLTDAQAMQMLVLQEGDSGTAQTQQPQSSDSPGAATESETEAKSEVVESADSSTPEPEPTPVVLAKDGVHTIPYEQLEEARKAAQHYKQQVDAYQRKLEEAQSQAAQRQTPADPNATQATGWISPDEIANAFGDFSEAGIAKGVASLVDKRTQAMLADVEARAEAKATERVRAELAARDFELQKLSHFDAINKAHPDAESIAQSVELDGWIKQQPSYAQAGIAQALQHGTAAQVIEALDAFKAATTPQKPAAVTPPPVDKQATVAAAKAVIAKAKATPPMSLSAMPAGSSAAVDEANAMLEMSDRDLMTKFGNKSPDQIMALMSRVL